MTIVVLPEFSARSWAHGTKDELHDEWGFLGISDNGIATLMTTGNNSEERRSTKCSFVDQLS